MTVASLRDLVETATPRGMHYADACAVTIEKLWPRVMNGNDIPASYVRKASVNTAIDMMRKDRPHLSLVEDLDDVEPWQAIDSDRRAQEAIEQPLIIWNLLTFAVNVDPLAGIVMARVHHGDELGMAVSRVCGPPMMMSGRNRAAHCMPVGVVRNRIERVYNLWEAS